MHTGEGPGFPGGRGGGRAPAAVEGAARGGVGGGRARSACPRRAYAQRARAHGPAGFFDHHWIVFFFNIMLMLMLILILLLPLIAIFADPALAKIRPYNHI